ncbi:hypothetical protein YC2023_073396 [Brassica napus]
MKHITYSIIILKVDDVQLHMADSNRETKLKSIWKYWCCLGLDLGQSTKQVAAKSKNPTLSII